VLEQLMKAYVERRKEEESFLEFSRRHSIDELRSQVAFKEAVGQ